MGHTPFGHAGEEALDEALRERFGRGFRHNEQSLAHRRARSTSRAEVRDGILTHTGEREPATLEGKIVRIVDRVAYINHDIDDAIRHGILSDGDLPRAEIELLGPTGLAADRPARARPRRDAPSAAGDIVQSEEIGAAMLSLRAFMFDRVYLGPAHATSTRGRATRSGASSTTSSRAATTRTAIVDYVAGMTDRFALDYAARLP